FAVTRAAHARTRLYQCPRRPLSADLGRLSASRSCAVLAPVTATSSSVCCAFDDRRRLREKVVATQHLLDLTDHLDQARPDLALEPFARNPKRRRSAVERKRAGAVAERERNADAVHIRLPLADRDGEAARRDVA